MRMACVMMILHFDGGGGAMKMSLDFDENKKSNGDDEQALFHFCAFFSVPRTSCTADSRRQSK